MNEDGENKTLITHPPPFLRCLGTETVEGTTRALESIDDIEGSDGFTVRPYQHLQSERSTATDRLACSV